MPDLSTILKQEITRLARRSTRPAIMTLKKDVAALKRQAAQHRRVMARLQRDNARLIAESNERLKAPPKASEATTTSSGAASGILCWESAAAGECPEAARPNMRRANRVPKDKAFQFMLLVLLGAPIRFNPEPGRRLTCVIHNSRERKIFQKLTESL